jgi:hypothetical protein
MCFSIVFKSCSHIWVESKMCSYMDRPIFHYYLLLLLWRWCNYTSLKKKNTTLHFTNRVNFTETPTDCSKGKFQITSFFGREERNLVLSLCLFKTKCEVVNYVALLIICWNNTKSLKSNRILHSAPLCRTSHECLWEPIQEQIAADSNWQNELLHSQGLCQDQPVWSHFCSYGKLNLCMS